MQDHGFAQRNKGCGHHESAAAGVFAVLLKRYLAEELAGASLARAPAHLLRRHEPGKQAAGLSAEAGPIGFAGQRDEVMHHAAR